MRTEGVQFQRVSARRWSRLSCSVYIVSETCTV